MHANFSNGVMREKGDKNIFDAICQNFGTEENIKSHIAVYGAYND